MTGHLSEADPARWEIDVPMCMPNRKKPAPLTLNARLHWRVKADLTHEIRNVVAWRAKAAHIPALEHVTVQLHYAPGDNRSSRDVDNLVATSKPACDGIVAAGVVPSDAPKWVTQLMPVIHGGTLSPGWPRRLWLVVEATPRPETEETPK